MTTDDGRFADIDREAVTSVTGEQVHVDRSLVRRLETRQADVSRSAVVRLDSAQARTEGSAIMYASVNQATLRDSSAGVLAGRSVACDQVRVGILAAPVIRGEVHALFDMRAFVALGVGIALGRAMIGAGKYAARRLMG